jgi:GT2 family glycosyltransferase
MLKRRGIARTSHIYVREKTQVTAATISIVSHGHGAMLRALLSDLSDQQQIGECRVVVTLNLAGEEFKVDDYPLLNITLTCNETPKGFGANHNAAFTYCDSPWFIVLNPDIRLPEPTILRRLISGTPMTSDGIRAPLVGNSEGGLEDSVRGNLSPLSLALRFLGKRDAHSPEGQSKPGRPFYWVAGMCMVVSSQAYKRIGGFDERLFLYCEDYDLCVRAYLAGYSTDLIKNVRVIHDAQRDSHRSFRHLRWHVASLLRVWTSVAFWKLAFSSDDSEVIEQHTNDIG